MVLKVLLVGSGAREHAIARLISKSGLPHELYCVSGATNPGIKKLAKGYYVCPLDDFDRITAISLSLEVNLCIIGPEAPLVGGLADTLAKAGILSFGPSAANAMIEGSKAFCRDLLREYKIMANPAYDYFAYEADGLDSIKQRAISLIEKLGDYVIKSDGLAGGKGVKVSGEHLNSLSDAISFIDEIFLEKKSFVVEEKLLGEEFSLISITDGNSFVHCPPIRDHKRAFEDDTGPNTGGMGTYSGAGEGLEFLRPVDIAEARKINEAVTRALEYKNKVPYKGVLYGGFMRTPKGVRVIEYNCRFGDPEAINILSLMQGDFLDLAHKTASGNLKDASISFSKHASVCKYAVPVGYPDSPSRGFKVDISGANENGLYLGAVDEAGGDLIATGSRTVAVVACAPSVSEAEALAEQNINKIKGNLYHRADVGKQQLISKYIKNMQRLVDDA